MVVADTRTNKSIQKQIASIDVDKVGIKKPLASKSVSPISKALCLSRSLRVVQYSQIDSIGVSGDKKGLHWYQWYDWYQ